MTIPDEIWAWEGNGGFLECNPKPIGPIEDCEKYIKAPVWRPIEELSHANQVLALSPFFSRCTGEFKGYIPYWGAVIDGEAWNGRGMYVKATYFLDFEIPTMPEENK
jgi:hypothetical protein